MNEQVVSCPYCLLGDQFGPMRQRPEWFICKQCGHLLLPGDSDFKCACSRCIEVNRAA